MSTARFHFALLLLSLLLATQSLAMTISGGFHLPASSSSKVCDGTFGRCDLGSEFFMESEISRRILATSTYISYGALSQNRVPCSTSGRSYYNCAGSGPVNPYTRSCSRITKCQRDTS